MQYVDDFPQEWFHLVLWIFFISHTVQAVLKQTSTDIPLQIPQQARSTFNCSGKESTQSCGFCYDTVFVGV